MLWDSQRQWLMEILTTSDMKIRQLRASLSTTLGIIHKLVVVICAVYCNAFPCNSSVQSCSCLVSHHLYRRRLQVMALLKKQTGIFITRVSVQTEVFFYAIFFVAFFSPENYVLVYCQE